MLLADKLLTLKKTALFKSLSKDELLAVASVTTVMNYQANEVVLSQQVPNTLVIVIKGAVKALEDDRAIKEIKSPVILGVSNLLLEKAGKYTWHAAGDDTSAFCIQKSHFLTIVYQCPQILAAFMQMPPDKAAEYYMEQV